MYPLLTVRVLEQNEHLALGAVFVNVSRDGDETRYQLERVGCLGRKESHASETLAAFFTFMGRFRPRLASWDGKREDLPLLLERAFDLEMSLPMLLGSESDREDFLSPASDHRHLSVRAGLPFRASPESLDAMAHRLGIALPIPSGKDSVVQLRQRAEVEALATYIAMLRLLHLRGELERSEYHIALQSVRSHLAAQSQTQPHLGAFLAGWPEA